MAKTKIELSLVLPGIPDARDKCVPRMDRQLQQRAGIDNVHLPERDRDHADRLCIHFNPGVISLAEVRELAERAGAKLEDRCGLFAYK